MGAAAAAAAAAGDDTAYGYARSGRVRRMHPVLGEVEIEEGRHVLEVASHVCQHPDGTQRPPHCAPLLFGSQAGRGGAGWVLRRAGSDDELIRGFGRVSDWVQRSLSEYTAVVCGIEDCLAAGVKELEVHVTGGGGKMIVNQLGSEIAPGAGRHTRNPVAPCRGFVRRVQDLAMEFDSLIVRHRDEVDEQALHLAECGSGLLRPANDEPEGTVVAPCAALPALDGVDRVTLTFLRLLARCGEPQYTSFCAGALAVAVGGAAPAASAATDGGDNVKADTDWPFISELLARHSDPDDTFDINTNIATVIENIPKMATDMWGKVAYVCAIAMTDTDVDRQVLGCALWQLLPRLLFAPTGSGWHRSASALRQRFTAFLCGDWRGLWERSSFFPI